MARIRTIKPEIHTDHKTGMLPDRAFRIFTGLFNLADRHGVLENNNHQIKAHLLPYCDEPADQAVGKSITLLQQRCLIVVFSWDGRDYLRITNFAKHQKIDDRYEKEIIPDFLNKINQLENNTVATVFKHRGNVGEGKGREKEGEGIGKEGNGREQVASESKMPADFEIVFSAYCESWEKTNQYKLTPVRKKWIQDAIAQKGVAGALIGIQNFRHDPYPDRPRFNDLEYLFGGTEKEQQKRIDRWCQPRTLKTTATFQEAAAQHQKSNDLLAVTLEMAAVKYGKD